MHHGFFNTKRNVGSYGDSVEPVYFDMSVLCCVLMRLGLRELLGIAGAPVKHNATEGRSDDV